MKRHFIALALILLAIPATAGTFNAGGPATTNNDDSCDIATLPAATLLLPYFEVDLDLPPSGPTTLFTITNVTNLDRIARITLWTEYGYPVISFNVYLTGYDVQSINLFDVIARGNIAPDAGTGTEITDRGDYSDSNPAIDYSRCDRLPGQLDNAYIRLMQNALTEGRVQALGNVIPACNPVGGVHVNATGYATIDVVGNCNFAQPNQAEYWQADIRYDNVLTGDYQQVDNGQDYAQANPLVHIRAMPEGGTPSTRTGTAYRNNFARTFYDHYAPADRSDARQPLPATFGARWVSGGPLQFETFYKIWREVKTGTGATCAQYGANAALPVREVVVFDENENFAVTANDLSRTGTSLLAVADDSLPQLPNGAVSGWTYFNLDADAEDEEATQNWVIVSMRAQGRYSVDFDATALGNGCTPPRAISAASVQGGGTIGPAPNENP